MIHACFPTAWPATHILEHRGITLEKEAALEKKGNFHERCMNELAHHEIQMVQAGNEWNNGVVPSLEIHV